MTQADTKEKFIKAWKDHINELHKIGHSLPKEESDEFMETIEEVEEYVKRAAEYTYD